MNPFNPDPRLLGTVANNIFPQTENLPAFKRIGEGMFLKSGIGPGEFTQSVLMRPLTPDNKKAAKNIGF